MSRLLRFNQNSDFATLANDAGPAIVSVTVPNGSSATVSNSIALGQAGSPIVYTIKDSNSNTEWACATMQYVDSVGQSIDVRVARVNATEVSIRAVPAGAITGSVTFTARVRSFIPPA